jgi:tetratricopeptide (TPR) repeat protein
MVNYGSADEVSWTTAKSVVRRRQELAQGDDLALALECTTYFQLVAPRPQQQVSGAPPLLFALRAVALCELGRWEDASADCRKVLSVDAEDASTQYNMHMADGIIRSTTLERESAIGCFTKAVRLRPASAEPRVHRAIALAAAAWSHGAAVASTGRASVHPGFGTAIGEPVNTLIPGVCAGSRCAQLLTDAVQDLEAVEQQSVISGVRTPFGTSRLRSACLCGLGRFAEAWEALRGTSPRTNAGGHIGLKYKAHGDPSTTAQSSLEAGVLVLLGRHAEAIEACTAMIHADASDRVGAHLMRGRCWCELGDVERAFADYREALLYAPDDPDVHEASAELFLATSCVGEAIVALNTAAKLRGSLSPRLAFGRGAAHLALGDAEAALRDFHCALRLNPNMPAASRARDGVAALKMMTKK